MGQVARFRPPPDEDAAAEGQDSAAEWSPRAKTLTIIAAALASWVVVGAVVYLVIYAV
jgi:hypothetical protein